MILTKMWNHKTKRNWIKWIKWVSELRRRQNIWISFWLIWMYFKTIQLKMEWSQKTCQYNCHCWGVFLWLRSMSYSECYFCFSQHLFCELMYYLNNGRMHLNFMAKGKTGQYTTSCKRKRRVGLPRFEIIFYYLVWMKRRVLLRIRRFPIDWI